MASPSAPPSPLAVPVSDVFTAFELVRPAGAPVPSAPVSRPAPLGEAPAAPGIPFFSRYVNWILLAGALLVLSTAAMYYWRRKQTTAAKEKSGKLELLERRLTEEVDAVSQRQAVMEEQLKRVATHSRSVEQGLSQALESWSETTEDLAKQLGAVQELKQELTELLAEDDAEGAPGALAMPEEQEQEEQGEHGP
jgi:hypothetical protein